MLHAMPSHDFPPIFTIGHSTHALPAFVALLQAHAVACVIDVRRLPGSRRYPQYDGPALAASLAPLDIGYVHLAALGGRRGRSLPVDEASPNGFWQNASFRRYADYAMGDAFQATLAQLLQLSAERRCALMCAEVLWWRCHRRIIADHLLARGIAVSHIMTETRTDAATLTPGATIATDGTVTYPA